MQLMPEEWRANHVYVWLLLQGVHAVFDGSPGKTWGEGEARKSKIVFIGKDLDAAALQEGLKTCLA